LSDLVQVDGYGAQGASGARFSIGMAML